MKCSYIWTIIWVVFYLIGLKFDLSSLLACKGGNIINGEYYRYFTGLFLHVNVIHLIINCIGIYWVGHFLNGKVNDWKLFVFSFVCATIANVFFSLYAKESISVGGSLVIFSLIGLIIVLQVFRKELPSFNPKSIAESWILGYAIFGNIPLFSGNISTLVIHVISLIVGILFGFFAIMFRFF